MSEQKKTLNITHEEVVEVLEAVGTSELKRLLMGCVDYKGSARNRGLSETSRIAPAHLRSRNPYTCSAGYE